MKIITNYLSGVNLGIEFCGVCLLILLLVAINMKKSTSKEMYYYKSFIASNVIALCTDILAYLVTGNKDMVFVLITMSILAYIATGFSAFYFYTYLQSHYNERYGIVYSERNFRIVYGYVIVVSLLYISSIWTKWFYFINSEYLYESGKYAALTGILYFPLLLICFYAAYKNRKIATKRETIIHSLFSVLYIIMGYIDATFATSFHYLVAVLFAFLIYIVISVEQQQELAEKETELVKSELNAMRLQMNPHFIYNTLASIDGLCMFDPEEARKLIAKFTKHLRGSYLDNSPSTIPFEKELENLESYFAVEQVRFPDINFVTDIKVSDFDVPPLTVQPVFENAIKHGICGKDETEGTITLSTFEKDNCYHIVISDDGVGFDINQRKEPDGRAHLGVANTKKRLEFICGGQMITTSEIGVGTTVDMIIPKKEIQ